MPITPTSTTASTQPSAISAGASNTEMATAFTGALKGGAELVEKSGSYYLKVNIQLSAGQGTSQARVDAGLARSILAAIGTGGRISQAETIQTILPNITDKSCYGAGEAILARLLLSACDDRKVVQLNGKRVRITNPAEGALHQGLASFWGSLGSKARWGAADPGVEPRSAPQNNAPQMNRARAR
jgi:hypothetical protein